MAKRMTEIDEDTGHVRSGRKPKPAKLIPWTRGPDTRARKIARALWG